MKETEDRVSVVSWRKLKKYIPLPKDGSYPDYTPTFGFVIDKFRTLYSIYISVTPNTKPDISGNIIVLGYLEEVFKISGNNVEVHWSGNNQSFCGASREAIDKAFEILDQ